MSGVRTIEVASSEDGMRLDRWFKVHYPGLGHGALQRMLRKGEVRLDGARAKAGARIVAGQMVRVPPLGENAADKPKVGTKLSDEDAALIRSLVLHRDAHVIALNKPPGMASQGGSKTLRHIDGMLDALIFEARERPRLVHRLDRDTSGLLLLGRTRKAAAALTAAFRSRRAQKVYWALVEGVPRPPQGRIDLALAKAGRAGDQRMVPADPREADAKRAETVFATIDHAGRKYAWIALSPLTGRTHQLRVHMAAIGHPVAGDRKYGSGESSELADGLHLHARSLRLPHPGGGMLVLDAPLPDHMRATWSALGFCEAEGDADILFADEESPQ